MQTMFVSWMAGPSATGSEKGTPSSMISAPPFCMASNIGTVSLGVGYPAVTKVTKAGSPWIYAGEKANWRGGRCAYFLLFLCKHLFQGVHGGLERAADDSCDLDVFRSKHGSRSLQVLDKILICRQFCEKWKSLQTKSKF